MGSPFTFPLLLPSRSPNCAIMNLFELSNRHATKHTKNQHKKPPQKTNKKPTQKNQNKFLLSPKQTNKPFFFSQPLLSSPLTPDTSLHSSSNTTKMVGSYFIFLLSWEWLVCWLAYWWMESGEKEPAMQRLGFFFWRGGEEWRKKWRNNGNANVVGYSSWETQ